MLILPMKINYMIFCGRGGGKFPQRLFTGKIFAEKFGENEAWKEDFENGKR